MSRHEIPALAPNHKVIVGWDHPMQTFFGQVIDRKLEARGRDNKIHVWVGCSLREIYEIDALAIRLQRYANLSPEIRSTLYGDKDEGR